LTPDEKRILASLGYVGGASTTKPPAPGDKLPDVKDMLPHYVRLSDARTQATKGNPAAIDTVREILQEVPSYSTARLFLGDMLLSKQQFAEAAKEYSAVANDQPENHEAHSSWANVLAAQGRFDEAIVHYRKAIDIEPASSSYHYYYAFTLIRVGKVAEAIKELEDAVRINPAFIEARMPLSKLLAESNRTAEAVEQYEAARKYRPDLAAPPWLPQRK